MPLNLPEVPEELSGALMTITGMIPTEFIAGPDAPEFTPGGPATIASITNEPSHGSGSQPWCKVARIDGTHFLKMYSTGSTTVNARFGTIDPVTGDITYGAEQSIGELADSNIPFLGVLSTSIAIIGHAVPYAANQAEMTAFGLAIDAVADTLTVPGSPIFLDGSPGSPGWFNGNSVTQSFLIWPGDGFFGAWHDASFAGHVLHINEVQVPDAATLNKMTTQLLVNSSTDRARWSLAWLNAARDHLLVVYIGNNLSSNLRARVLTNTAGTVAPVGAGPLLVANDESFRRWMIAPFPGVGAVVVDSDASDPGKANVYCLDVNFTTGEVTLNTILVVDLDYAGTTKNFTAFGAESIDANNVLLTGTGNDFDTDQHWLWAWIIQNEGGVYTATPITEQLIGDVTSSAGQMSLAQLDNDWYVIQLAYPGVGSSWKIKLARS